MSEKTASACRSGMVTSSGLRLGVAGRREERVRIDGGDGMASREATADER